MEMKNPLSNFHEIKASISSAVTFIDENGIDRTYTLVPPGESNPSEGKISVLSPIGNALLNRGIKDQIKIKVPAGEIEILITQILNKGGDII